MVCVEALALSLPVKHILMLSFGVFFNDNSLAGMCLCIFYFCYSVTTDIGENFVAVPQHHPVDIDKRRYSYLYNAKSARENVHFSICEQRKHISACATAGLISVFTFRLKYLRNLKNPYRTTVRVL